MSEIVKKAAARVMQTIGCYDNLVTIGDSTHYVDANSPFSKKLGEKLRFEMNRQSVWSGNSSVFLCAQ